MNKFFLALTAGIAIGILIAPAKGSETRKKIKDAVDELKDEWDRLLNREERMVNNAISTIAEN